MKAITLSASEREWQPGSGQFGENSIYQATEWVFCRTPMLAIG